MRRGYTTIIVCMLALVVNSCIDPLELEIDDRTWKLVVDGMITNEPGPYTVRLSRSKRYSSYTDSWNAVETGARVIVSDDKGNEETLTETKPGTYLTSVAGIQGQIGNTYSLSIRTKDGKQYTSSPETLLPVPEMDDLYFEVRPVQVLNESDVERTEYVVDVFVDIQDPAEARNYYLWQWQSTFRVSTQPWDYSEKVGNVRVPMPKDCCEICWVTNTTNTVNIQDDRLLNGANIKRHLVTSIPVTAQHFGTKYYLEVKQFSLSEAGYDFWRILKSQIENGGSIQDTPPATIIGNITNLNNPDERALGFFGASAVSKSAIFIRREELGVRIAEYVFPDDCRVLSKSTTEVPAFW
ncbi:DUF4249 domain-containing protein [Pontibacter populi]|uniref:DUF4249 domain-containing protein n=1 Tax=Pontibacter populi TaxID=890055 RepID=A0ABV1RNR4_9BACT